ncbi:MAG: ATP-binding protein, partial [Bacteriovorax sp.]|nr:ATP-binding protein [Bacteriovorax sp.]
LQKHKSKYQLLENYKKLKEVKSQLIQSEKMASLGTISAGIAHEINNPLSFLLTNSEVLKEYLTTIIQYIKRLENPTENETDITKLKKSIDYILQDTPMLMNESLEGIDRIKEIVNGLKTFSRADDGDIKEFDINTCIETSLRLVSNELKHKCKITKNFQSLPPVRGSAGQIIQVLTNLLVNSAQAIEDFGLIEISTKESENNIIVSIKDSGKGISQENLDQLFTPFFTTKPTGQGTGLGLSISYGIIKKHKGDITVESTIGKGTEFCIFLPKEQR